MSDVIFKIEWRAKAVDDIMGIIRFIGKDSPNRAISFGVELRETVESLATMPNKGRLTHTKDIRELVLHKNYIAIFRVKLKSKTIEILRLKHAAQKWP